MSGRGLGYTGGTLDKLESIPGLRTDLDADAFIRQVNRVGLAVIGQSERLASADRTLYALRDVTGTVRSLPLIASSIISKKIAAGCESVVLDVKTGSGALMPTHEESLHLARLMVRIGGMTGRRFSALLTDMSQPLGAQVGNALEVEEAVQILRGERGGALLDVSLALAESMILSSGLMHSQAEAAGALRAALESGSGLEKLRAMIEAQGGDPRVVDDTGRLPCGEVRTDVPAREDGYIGRIEPQDVGNAARSLGAGRYRKTDVIDPGVGVIVNKRVGESVVRGEPVFTVVSRRDSDTAEAMRLLERAVTVSPEAPDPIPLIHEHIGPDDCAGRNRGDEFA